MRWRTPLILLEVVLAICFVAVLLTGAGLWRLAQGPVSVGFATPYVKDVLGRASSVSVDIDDTVLTWSGWRRPVEIRAIGVSARGSDGRLIAAVPELSIGFSIRAMFQGRLEPTSLDVHRLMVRLVRTEDSRIRVGFGEDHKDQPAYDAGNLASLATRAPDPEMPLGYLRRVRLVDASVTIDDRGLGTSWGASSLTAEIRRSRRGTITVTYDIHADLGNQQPRLTGVARYLARNRRIETASRLEGLWPSRLSRKADVLKSLRHADFPVEGTVTATVDTAGKVYAASVDLTGGAGSVTIPGVYDKPLSLTSSVLHGEMRQSPDRFVIQRFEADLGGARLGLQAVVTPVNDLASVNGEISLRGVPVAELRRYWPPVAAPSALKWISANMTGGTVEEASAKIIARVSLPDRDVRLDTLSGAVSLKGVAVHYFRPLPPVTDIAATARFGPESLTFDISEGKTAGLRVNKATVELTELGTELEKLAVVVDLEGATKDALAILDNPRLRYISKAGFDGRRASGDVKARLEVRLPLLANLTLDKVKIDADANLRDLGQPGVAPGIDLSDATMNVKVDTAHMVATGKGKLQGVPSRYNLEVRFDDAKDYNVSGKAAATITAADVKRTLGVDVGAFVKGGMALDLRLVQRAGRRFEVAGNLGLEGAELSIPMLEWTKARDRAGSASFLVSVGGNLPPRVQRFNIRTGELQVDGGMTFRGGDKWSLDRASVDRFVLGNNDLRADVEAREQGGFDVSIEGRLLDGERLIDLAKKGDGADDGENGVPPIWLKAKFDEVYLGPGRVVQKVEGDAVYDGEYLRRLRLASQLSAGRHLNFDMRAQGKERSVLITSDDAGEALKRLDIVRNVRGGELRLKMIRPLHAKDARWVGDLWMGEYSIMDAPVLAELMSKASLTGLLADDRGIHGNRGKADFTYSNGEIKIKRAYSLGSQLGLTVENGEIDLERDTIYLKGTIIPAYTINKFLGMFWLEPNTGIFAVSYRVQGSFDAPKMRVNPLSLFAPGFLRNMLDVLDYGKADNSSPDVDTYD